MSGSRSYALFRLVVGALVVALIVAFTIVQLASDALASRAAAAGTLPRRIPVRFGLAVYRTLDRIAPAPYVETTLSEEALTQSDPRAAERYAVRLPASPIRDELLARVALMRGNFALAQEYFLAAPDPEAVGESVKALAARDPAAAYALARLLEVRLSRNATHPDAVAEAYWQMGRLANREAWREVPGSALQRTWLRLRAA